MRALLNRPPPAARLAAMVLSLALALSACASRPPASDPDAVADFEQTNDPLEPTNRVLYVINDGLDTMLVRPLAIAYDGVLPQFARTGIHNFLNNLNTPVRLANDIMQAKPRRAGDTLMRMLINTTIGVGGLFDVATGWGYPDHASDFGQTLAVWGVPEGPYLFLPLLGPSSPRDATGLATDVVIDPLTWVGHGNIILGLGYVRYGLTAIDQRSRLLGDLDKVKESALDPYATFRSLYRQYRQSKLDDVRSDDRATPPLWFRNRQPPAAAPAPATP